MTVKLVLRGISRDVLQGAGNGLWHRRWGGQVSSLWHISINIVRRVRDCVNNSIVARVTRWSLGDNHIAGVWARGFLQRSSLLTLDSVSSLVATEESEYFSFIPCVRLVKLSALTIRLFTCICRIHQVANPYSGWWWGSPRRAFPAAWPWRGRRTVPEWQRTGKVGDGNYFLLLCYPPK